MEQNNKREIILKKMNLLFKEHDDVIKNIKNEKKGDFFLKVEDNCKISLNNLKNKDTIMNNSLYEKINSLEIIKKANGNVFIAGLGIGMIILPIQKKANVNSITIIEKHKEVIDLVSKNLPFNKKVKIINQDIFKYKIPNNTKYDTMYFDIYGKVDKDKYIEGKEWFEKNFKKYLISKKINPDRFIGSWYGNYNMLKKNETNK